jgi:hypothetical protein
MLYIPRQRYDAMLYRWFMYLEIDLFLDILTGVMWPSLSFDSEYISKVRALPHLQQRSRPPASLGKVFSTRV